MDRFTELSTFWQSKDNALYHAIIFSLDNMDRVEGV